MRYSVTVKFLAVLMTAICLVAALGGISAIVAMEKAGLYVNSLDELQSHEYNAIAKTLSHESAQLYLCRTYGDVPYLLQKEIFPDPQTRNDSEYWLIRLSVGGEAVYDSGTPAAEHSAAYIKQIPLRQMHYAIVSSLSPSQMERQREALAQLPPDAPETEENEVELVPENYDYTRTEMLWVNGSLITYYLYFYPAQDMTASVFLREEVLESSSLHILTSLYPQRYGAIAVLVFGLIAFFAGLVFLFWSAGKQKDGQIKPSALNLLPIDLYAIVTALAEFGLVQLMRTVYGWIRVEGPHPGNLSIVMVILWAIIVVALGLLIAFAAQIKVKNGYIWRHSLLGRLIKRLGQFCRFAAKAAVSLTSLLPVIWQWLLIAGVLGVFLFAACILSIWYSAFVPVMIVLFVLCAAVVAYGAYGFGCLMSGAERMSHGDLSRKVPEKYLLGSFRSFARQLNTLSDTVKEAAEHELRSERMKSELITNISHDIKTPLTSIINFVDLLGKPHTAEQEKQYLEVLSRQSGRMKKLIEDLLELGRASTGNLAMNIMPIDLGESVNQALGEFADKLDAARLTPVFSGPDEPVVISADGRLVWRIMGNLLSNAVKYAMPDTRVYIDLEQEDGQVMLSVKNISREVLSVPADELMERFVRGDASRVSEGSGLGLNIAKSLMEVQGGQLQLTVDGDLFKVTLIFRA